MTEEFPPHVPLARIAARLPRIFPEGTPNHRYLVRDIAARTVFVALYAGAVEGSGRWFRPNQVTRMTDAQAADGSAAARERWVPESLARRRDPIPGRWYADNTREPIRDETLRNGLVEVGAVVERPGVPTTSAAPRYALTTAFAELLVCDDESFPGLAAAWRERHLSAAQRMRIQLRGATATAAADGVLVTLPNLETRRLDPGPSAVLTKGVVEEFARRWLADPALVWLSESRQKVVARDEALAARLGIRIDAQRLLPDVILADVGADPPLLVFVEVVATAGPVDAARRRAFVELAREGGLGERSLAFVSAFEARESPAYRAVSGEIAWDTAVWFRTEPEGLLVYAGESWRHRQRALAAVWRGAGT